MQLWLRDHPLRATLGPLPDSVELHLIPSSGPPPDGIAAAEFLVPPHGARQVLELLPRMRSLRVVQAASSGVEWLLPWVPPGVTVCSARGTRDVCVAEWVVTAVLTSIKEFPRLWRQQEERRWAPSMFEELSGRRALIVGYGSIGRAVEARLLPFGVTVVPVDRHPLPGVHGIDELTELLPAADIVILLVPETTETRGLFDAATMARLKHGSLLVNACRGAVVDTGALLELVAAERIRAVLDVTDPEPLPRDHPLWTAPGLLLTPHMAGDSAEAERRIYRLIGEQVRRHLRGERLVNVVEPEVVRA